jgi:flagellar basal-body rod protein FlgB
MNLFGKTFFLLGKVLDLRSARHEVLTTNIANADTPGYVGFDFVFEEELHKAAQAARVKGLARTHVKHFPQGSSLASVTGRVEVIDTPFKGQDRNSVNIEKEMVKVAENSLLYEATVQMVTKKFQWLKEAIREGGR